jgi:hypothetical protein
VGAAGRPDAFVIINEKRQMGFPKKTGVRDSEEVDYPGVQLATD